MDSESLMNEHAWYPPDAWLVVQEDDRSQSLCIASDLPRLDAAVTAYLDSGKTRDTLLCLTFVEGTEYHVRASCIRAFWLNTPEHRKRFLMHERHTRDEDRELRSELGLPWKEP